KSLMKDVEELRGHVLDVEERLVASKKSAPPSTTSPSPTKATGQAKQGTNQAEVDSLRSQLAQAQEWIRKSHADLNETKKQLHHMSQQLEEAKSGSNVSSGSNDNSQDQAARISDPDLPASISSVDDLKLRVKMLQNEMAAREFEDGFFVSLT